MESGSEYSIPIFISSCVYNLVDLRAELARYLREIGYRPVLSSENGFPHEGPELQPWESCLPALKRCYLVVLIIDGHYGDSLPWENFRAELGEEDISPTHGEYRFAHKHNMRLLVFVRRSIEPHYQMYRQALKTREEERQSRVDRLSELLPKHIDLAVLRFLKEVKTTKPIPWIRPFDDVTEIKLEIQKQLLNELARLFMARERRLGGVAHELGLALEEMDPARRGRVLQNLGGGDLVQLVEHKTAEMADLKRTVSDQVAELEKLRALNQRDDSAAQQVEALQKEVRSKEALIAKLNAERTLAIADSGSLGTYTLPFTQLTTIGQTAPTSIYLGSSSPTSLYVYPQCESCTMFSTDQLKRCATCSRSLCSSCWEGGNGMLMGTSLTLQPRRTSESSTCSRCEKARRAPSDPSS